MEEKGEDSVCKYCRYDERKVESDLSCLKPRTLLNSEKYLIGKVLGHGGFGITYIGFDTILLKKVAIKEYCPSALAYRDASESIVPLKGEREEYFYKGLGSFLEEARKVAKFSENPNIVDVYDFFEENKTGYIVMKFLEGENLQKFLTGKGGKISVEEAIKILFPILDALKKVHFKKLYQRDVSPQNIIITKNHTPVLIDFGAARYIVDEKSRCSELVLRPGYSPLEQYSSEGKIGPWTDIYACGATLYSMITGIKPPPTTDRVLKDELQKPSKTIADLHKNISKAGLDNAILRSLSVIIDDRFQTIDEFENALEETITQELELQPQPEPESPPKLPKRIRPLLAKIAIVLLLLGLSYIFYLYVQKFIPDATNFIISKLTPTPTSTVTPIKIRKVTITNEEGEIIDPKEETYHLKPRAKVTIKTSINGTVNRNSTVMYHSASQVDIGTEGTYVVPDKPGGVDLITVKAVDNDTGKQAQIVIRIKIITETKQP